ncbi:HipA N-terminal domain-containing protein [Kiritimatiella glycovorans]|uniref:HipA N-terminal domain-containing protein n=1 Tax=Kiritimatiella glycovorans TaxID=1307763 RepID=UPI00069B719F|nr:HipA N-terminal domain-containing protein [Kiritimatiella glycovorans]
MTDGDKKVLRRAEVFQSGRLAGNLLEQEQGGLWVFEYIDGYGGAPISLTLPVRGEPYTFKEFPAVFDGLLPEGAQLEALLKTRKIDRNDYFKQLVTVGGDLVGSLSVCIPKDAIAEEKEG